MPRTASNRTNYNYFTVSSFSETAINTPQTLDLGMLLPKGDIWQPEPRSETNEDEATGLSGADRIYRRGQTGKMGLNFEKLRPSEAAMILAYGLGKCVSTAAGTGYLHTITEQTEDVELGVRSLPTFTSCQNLGRTVSLQRILSNAVASGGMTFKRDEWVTAKAELVSTGAVDSAYATETVTAMDNATSLTLSAAVEGADAQSRLNNVQSVMGLYNGAWRKLEPTAVSGATPAVVTIPSLGGTGVATTYEVVYAATYPAWAASAPIPEESALQVSNMCLWVGGKWTGTEFAGGFPLSARLDTFDWIFNNDLKAEFTACAGGEYAGRMIKGMLKQEIKVSADMYDILMEEWRKGNRYFGIWVLCEGMEYDTGHKYTVELVFPRVGILDNTVKDNSGRLMVDSNIAVLADATYGQIVAHVKNMWPQYAA